MVDGIFALDIPAPTRIEALIRREMETDTYTAEALRELAKTAI